MEKNNAININWSKNTYLGFQNKKDYNFIGDKTCGSTPMLPITTNVFTYLLANRLTQIQSKTFINAGNNEYFLAKAVNLQKEKHINKHRLDVFLKQNNVNRTEAVNYKKPGYNKFSIYNIFSLLKKDRFFLNEKFYQNILGKRAFNVYRGGIYGFEKNLKILKKYNEYFERQIYLMSEQIDEFLGKDALIPTAGVGSPFVTRNSAKTPVMGWTRNVTGRAYLEIWKRLTDSKINSIRNNSKSFYVDERSMLNIEDLSLMALKNLRDYELYFGMIFYKKEIGRYLSKVGVGRNMYLDVHGRNATRFNFLKDAGYRRVKSNYRLGVGTNYGLLRSLYTKKHFPTTSLELEKSFDNFSFFNTEIAKKISENTPSNTCKFSKKKEQRDILKIKFLRKNKNILVTESKGVVFKSLFKKPAVTARKVTTIEKKQYLKKEKKSPLKGNIFTRKKTNWFVRLLNLENKKIIKKNGLRSTVLLNMNIKLNRKQLQTLLASTIFHSLNYPHLNTLNSFSKSESDWGFRAGVFKANHRRLWGVANQPFSDVYTDNLLRSPTFILHKMGVVAPGELNKKADVSELNKRISGVLTNNVNTLKKTKLTLSSLRFIKREKKVWKKIIWGLLNLKNFSYNREKLILKGLVRTQNLNVTNIKSFTDLEITYKNLAEKQIDINKKQINFMDSPKILENIRKLNKYLTQYNMLKTIAMFGNYFNRPIFNELNSKDREYKTLLKRNPYKSAKYKLFRLNKMFDLGLSERVNARLGMSKKAYKKIVRGTLRGRRALTNYIGSLSNPTIGGNLTLAFSNRIGKNTVILTEGMGLTNNLKKLKKLKSYPTTYFNLNYIWKFNKKNNKIQKINFKDPVVTSGSLNFKKIKILKKKEYIKFDSDFMKSREGVSLKKIEEQVNKMRRKNLNLVKKYLGIANYTPTMLAAKAFNIDLSAYFDMHTKINFCNQEEFVAQKNKKNKKIKSRGAPRIKHTGFSSKISLKEQDLKNLHEKLGLTGELSLLSVIGHGTSIDEERKYILEYLANNTSQYHIPYLGNAKRKENTKIKNQINMPSAVGTTVSLVTEEGLTSNIDKIKNETYSQLSKILDSRRNVVRDSINGVVSWNSTPHKANRKRFIDTPPAERQSQLEEELSLMWWQVRNAKRFKMWEHELSSFHANNMKRLCKFSKIGKSILSLSEYGRPNFMNKKSFEFYRGAYEMHRKWNEMYGEKIVEQKLQFLRVKKKNQFPFRISGLQRVSLKYPSATFLASLNARYRWQRVFQQTPILNDVENDDYTSELMCMKAIHGRLFKSLHDYQIKIKVFGDEAARIERNRPYFERLLKTKYHRGVYTQFGPRKFPTFWYRISRKKFPLKNQKKEWGIKIPLAERFIFPFDTQVWNTTYDSSVVYYKNIGWSNFAKGYRRLEYLRSFYRYGREHDESITLIPASIPVSSANQDCTFESYENFVNCGDISLDLVENVDPTSHWFPVAASRHLDVPTKHEINRFYETIDVDIANSLNIRYRGYRETLNLWHKRMKPLLGFFGLKTYYTYNSYLMRVNNEIKTRRYRTLFSNFAFAFKLNKTDFSRNLAYYNFADVTRNLFRIAGLKVDTEARNMFDSKAANAWLVRAFKSKYRYLDYTGFQSLRAQLNGRLDPVTLTAANNDYYTEELSLAANPVFYAKNDSIFVETFSKFRFRNKILRSSQNLQLRFINAEAKDGFSSFTTKNLVW